MKRGIWTAVGLAVLIATVSMASAASAAPDTGNVAGTAAVKKCKMKKKAAPAAAKKKKKCKAKRVPVKPTPAPDLPTSRVRAQLTWSNSADIFMQVRDVAGNYGLNPGSNEIANSTYQEASGSRTFIDNAFLAPARPFSVAICAGVAPPAGTTAKFTYTDRNGNTTTVNISFEGMIDEYFFTEPGSYNPGGTPCT